VWGGYSFFHELSAMADVAIEQEHPFFITNKNGYEIEKEHPFFYYQ
jgi:hypothetical protein